MENFFCWVSVFCLGADCMSGFWAMGSFVFEVGVSVGTAEGFWVKILVEIADFYCCKFGVGRKSIM